MSDIIVLDTNVSIRSNNMTKAIYAKVTFNYQPIENYIKINGCTKSKFCESCGISLSTLNGMIKGKRYKLMSLIKIADFMNLPLDAYLTISYE